MQGTNSLTFELSKYGPRHGQNSCHGLRVRMASPTQSQGAALHHGSMSAKALLNELGCEHLGMVPDVLSDVELLAPDVIIIQDNSMNDLSELSHSWPDTPVLVVCSNALVVQRYEAAHASSGRTRSYDFVAQPLSPNKLERAVSRAITLWAESGDSPHMAVKTPFLTPSDTTPCSQPPTPGPSAIESPLGGLVPAQDYFQAPQFLLVEDNPINLKMLTCFMRKLQKPYRTAANGQEAVLAYKENPGQFKCVLMDISMPVMDGLEATRHIRAFERYNGIVASRILAITGLGSENTREEATRSGVNSLHGGAVLGSTGRVEFGKLILHVCSISNHCNYTSTSKPTILDHLATSNLEQSTFARLGTTIVAEHDKPSGHGADDKYAVNDAAEVRRLKKRELDRKAQRLARERTKNRITQVESMVDNLRQDESNAQVATLMDQLGKVTKERDNLLQVLDSLGSTVRRHIGDNNSATTTSEPRSEPKSESPAYARPAQSESQSTPNEQIVPIMTQSAAPGTSNFTILELPVNPLSHHLFTYNGWSYTVSNEHYPSTMAFGNSILTPADNGFIRIQPPLPGFPPTPEEFDVVIPKARFLCRCSSPTNCTSNYHDAKPNFWRAIDKTLVKLTKLSAKEILIEDYNAEDMPVRAIITG
ncbi:hypothetical protein FOVSG1_013527 [Fusarium oxysporum f. sp. vasinfectum]